MSLSLQNLMGSFRQAALVTGAQSFAASLNAIIGAHGVLSSRAGDASIDRSLETMTRTLAQFAADEADQLSPSEWATAASALHAAGLLISRRGETPQSPDRVNDVFLAVSEFSSLTRRSRNQRATVSAQDLFFNDRALADTILTLKGWWHPGTLQPEILEPLGTVLAQVGLACGADRWAIRNWGYSNLAGAFHVFFDGGDTSLLEGTKKLLRPFTYFEAAAAWRPETLGYQEMILTSILDRNPVSRTTVMAQGLPPDIRRDRFMSQIIKILGEAATNDGRNVDLLDPVRTACDTSLNASGQRYDAHLPDFLRTAAEPLN